MLWNAKSEITKIVFTIVNNMTRHCITDQSKAGGTYTTPRNKDLYEMKAKTPAELKKFPSLAEKKNPWH